MHWELYLGSTLLHMVAHGCGIGNKGPTSEGMVRVYTRLHSRFLIFSSNPGVSREGGGPLAPASPNCRMTAHSTIKSHNVSRTNKGKTDAAPLTMYNFSEDLPSAGYAMHFFLSSHAGRKSIKV